MLRLDSRAVVVVALGVVVAAAAPEARQAGGSALQGHAVDEQGAVLPGVAIVVTSQLDGTYRETVSGPDGVYFVPGLLPGRYRITADLAGFKRLSRTDVVLLLGTTQTVELRLEVGGIQETVTVSGEAPPVDLTSARVGGNVASREILDLPSPTRNFISFVAMLPGVQLNPSAEGSDSISVNGQSNAQVTYVLDGGNNTDDNSGSPSGGQARTPLEVVEEFQIQTNQFDVEFGRTTGGVVNAITKRGSNAFRGSAFGYLTNSAMTAQSIFARQSDEGEADTDKHQYGGTIGGPIVRDKLHFFASFERYVIGTGLTNVFPSRPDLNWSEKSGLNGRNYMIRVDHQINADNTYTFRYLTERQPNRDLLTGDRATLTTRNYELDTDQTASAAYNRVLGTKGLYTVRASIETEDIERGAEPGTFLETRRKDQELPVLARLTFDEQGHTNGHHRNAQAPGLDQTVNWFLPGKAGDHDLKLGLQYLYARNVLDEQGSMNGVFAFATDRPFDAADPSTYPERLTIRVPSPAGQTSFTHSIAYYVQDKWRATRNLTITLGLRYDVDIFPFEQPFNPLLTSGNPVDANNYQPRAGFAYNIDGRSVVRGGIGRYYEKLFVGQASPLQANGVFGNSFIVQFPTNAPDPGPSNGRLPAHPLLVGGPTVNRALLAEMFPQGLLTRNAGTVQYDTPDRQMPRSTQVSFGYERQIGERTSFGVDYVRNRGRNWVGFDLNPGFRVDTTRTGRIVRTDLFGLASQLAIAPFVAAVNSRYDYTGVTRYDGLNLSAERRFAGFWSARASYTLGYARGNNGGAALGTNNFQVLGDKNLHLNEGPLDTDRRHNVTLGGRVEVPRTGGLTVSGLFRFMSGRPFTLIDSSVDADRNGITADPLPAGTYTGAGANAISVKSDGGRNGAYGPNYAQLDVRFGYRVRMTDRTLDIFGEVFNLTDRSNYTNPPGDRRLSNFLVLNGLVGGGFPRQAQVGIRLGF